MSSCPGSTLEQYLEWSLGVVPSPEVISLFEEYRERVEDLLLNFDEEKTGSWRTYSFNAFDFIPEETYTKAQKLLGIS